MSNSSSKVAVVAVGGNALIKDKAHSTVEDQFDAADETMGHIAEMIKQGWNVVVTHGNGPQVGFILRRSELSSHELHTVPLDYCGADTQGAIGYMFQKALTNHFRQMGLDKKAATVITQTEVSKDDPAFKKPSKPIGSFLDEATAKERMKEGKTFVEDAGRGWRQVVASPRPMRIVEQDAIKSLVDNGFIVVAAGGGGIPVISKPNGDLIGIDAVIDKDLGSALLASEMGVDLLLISTAVEKVALNFNKPDQKWIDEMTVAEAKQYIEEGHFLPGSMLPKMQACIEFLEKGGKQCLITDPPNIPRALKGETGTWIVP